MMDCGIMHFGIVYPNIGSQIDQQKYGTCFVKIHVRDVHNYFILKPSINPHEIPNIYSLQIHDHRKTFSNGYLI